MATQWVYRPALDHLFNCVAALEIELGRLQEEQRSLQVKLQMTTAEREALLRAAGLPPTGPLNPAVTRPVPPAIAVVNQTLASYQQALADLRRQIEAQQSKVASARRELTRQTAPPAGRAAFPAHSPGR